MGGSPTRGAWTASVECGTMPAGVWRRRGVGWVAQCAT